MEWAAVADEKEGKTPPPWLQRAPKKGASSRSHGPLDDCWRAAQSMHQVMMNTMRARVPPDLGSSILVGLTAGIVS